ncbi:hypothetical protein [Alteromonas sp. ASW11-130]|uniref:hypothetical protein n=1 Tax=Alteromonas sp. ASW11-130 TaxID=3015775 RepID=UPI0022418E6A|nr:hypothetical protein [Alteromonas sp. ASW11-130]MCW8091593.1 hypothetical protein [Alteromonas sp. ASW11-130]
MAIQRNRAGSRKTVDLDENTNQQLERLKEVFGTTSNSDVIRKAIKLSILLANEADNDNSVVFERKNQDRVLLRLDS